MLGNYNFENVAAKSGNDVCMAGIVWLGALQWE